MRILWVKAGRLLPVDTGGKIRSYHLLRHLAARHDVRLLSYYAGAPDRAYERALAARFPGADTLTTGVSEATAFARGLDYLRRLPSGHPYAVAKFAAPEVARRVA